MKIFGSIALLGLLSLGAGLAGAESDGAPQWAADPVLAHVDAEIQRAMSALADSDPAPYFIGVEVTDTRSIRIVGESGGLHAAAPSHRRWMDVDVRVGSRDLDSSHALRSASDRPARGGRWVPLTGGADGTRRAVWLEINDGYEKARERWARVEAESNVLVEEAPAEDLAEVEPVVFLGPTPALDDRREPWAGAVRRASRVFAEHPAVTEGTSTFSGESVTRWFVSSEGSRIRHGETRYRIDLNVQTVADDGERLALYDSFDSHDAAGLPDADPVVARARSLVADLVALRDAPMEEPYAGPTILSDRAAGVFFHEIFGHRVEGHRLKRIDNAQTFRNRKGQPILPEFLSIHDDPTLVSVGGHDLRGHYRFDNQGVRAQRVTLVEHGVLRGFLQSRSPVAQGDRPNGHGRRSAGNAAVSRQGSLVVTASESVDQDELRRELLELARASGREYALYVDEIQGGFTFTGRSIPNAFNVNATRAYRVYVDGRPDRLVRGVDLIGTPLEALAKIVRAGPTTRVFNGNCGAESGWVPVSAASPYLLLESIETQRKRKDQVTPPLIAPPLAGGDAIRTEP